MTVFRFSNLSSEIHKYRPSSSYHAVPAGRRNKMLEQVSAGDSKDVGLYKIGAQIWQPKNRLDAQIKCLAVRSSAPHEIEDCGHKPCKSIGNGCPPSNRFGQIICPLVLYKASLISTPFTLKGHSFCSRILEITQIETLGITSASSALAAPHAGHAGKTCCHVFVCACGSACL